MTIRHLGISTFQRVHKQVFMQGAVGESAQQQSSDVFSFETTVLGRKKENDSLAFVREVCNNPVCFVILRFCSLLRGNCCAIKSLNLSSYFGPWRSG